MGIDKNMATLASATELRSRAEKRSQPKETKALPSRTKEPQQRSHQELEIYQIELEMQNKELTRVHKDLHNALNKFSEMYDFAPVGYFTFDSQGTIHESNINGAQLLGAERQLLIGTPFALYIADAAGRKVFSDHLALVSQRHVNLKCELNIRRNDGTVMYCNFHSIAITSSHTSGCILTSIVDNSIRKALETEVKDARKYAENIVENVLNPLLVFSSDLKIITANRSFYETFKVTPEATIGHFIYDLGNRQWNIPKLRVLFEAILPNKTEFNDYEIEHNFPGIGKRVILFNARKIFREKIASYIILLGMEDITERKQMTLDLQNAHDKLEITVQERTAELTRSNLQLTVEIEERKNAERLLQSTYKEIKQLKDRLQAENIHLQQELAKQYNFGEIVGQNSLLTHVFSQVEQVAPMNATVLLLGETGTGKGIIARSIHSRSSRKGRALITIDCTTLPATLVESELFGRERGAFTGSDTKQIGRFELADGGTIFLDEIGDMPIELQCKLLRVIQDGEFERLGSPRTIKTDVRIIAATNRNLSEEVKCGRFREDLFYRLNVFPITIPPLRQRMEDIPLLVNHFIAKFNKKIGKKIETVSASTLNALQEYHWPGNVRELENVIERAVIVSQGNSLQVLDSFELIPNVEGQPTRLDVKSLVEFEHDYVLQILEKTGWRIDGKDGAALLLGLNPSTLRARMRKYGISRHYNS
jgi:transcriptional regulator with GAF, ATPase, and Fis domain/PAS domain-containing protein